MPKNTFLSKKCKYRWGFVPRSPIAFVRWSAGDSAPDPCHNPLPPLRIPDCATADLTPHVPTIQPGFKSNSSKISHQAQQIYQHQKRLKVRKLEKDCLKVYKMDKLRCVFLVGLKYISISLETRHYQQNNSVE